MKYLIFSILAFILSSCWPSSISFRDQGSMPPEWQFFSVKTLENNAPNAPLIYPLTLSEDIKDAVQNNTRLKLLTKPNTGEVQIEGVISNYQVSPIAIQAGDLAAKNRLTIQVNFSIFITKPKEDVMKLSVNRFADFDSNQDFVSVEQTLIQDINKQITQDVINKLLSNW